HAFLAAADEHLARILLIGPLHRQTELAECLVERRQMPVALGVGQYTVAVKDERGHAARPALPNTDISDRVMSTTSARTARNSDGGSHLSFPAAPRRKSRLDFIYVSLSAVEMLTFAQPREIKSRNCSSASPLPPCRAIGMGRAATMSDTRWKSSTGA